ncbi:MAG: hypothetical protein A2X28_08995 [Elusimicrobia bacterium GWA2_56_46]|nr:MAG: hypothetical protein A2X28_08995 [Elusimicrobia bacterium GWA2_56_46]OGR54439.1 MAG: hypothetical protein A2X39_04075 [Elusimicrobia bacterium GWC2_56_31]HBB67021.1 hypothetical protein [Elusimicrobiota bacterium]HBW22581.1 hypothetical protein [Elusimicrobiota bacterium]
MNHNRSISKATFTAVFFALVCALQAPARAGVPAPKNPKNNFQSGADFLNRERTGHIWPDMIFLHGTSYDELAYTMSRNRDIVRKTLLREFGSLFIPLAAANANLDALAETITQTILNFDQIHDKRKDEAMQGILENQFRAEIDELYSAYGLGDGLRRVDFLYSGSPMVRALKAHSTRESLPRELLNNVDYVIYGSYLLQDKTSVSVTLTVEKLSTGQTRSFEAAAPIATVMKLLAKKVFDFFQSNEYSDWVDPQPDLQWIPPAPGQPRATAASARLYCRGQNARLPYARELLMASQGTSYRPGGIPPLQENDIYIVLDKQRRDEQHYFFTGRAGEATGGPVRTSAGYSVINGSYWCVRGTANRQVSVYEEIYALIRKPGTPQPVRAALECILAKLDDFGARQENAGAFSTIEEAAEFLSEAGYTVNLPE